MSTGREHDLALGAFARGAAADGRTVRLVTVSAGLGQPSTTQLLADRLTGAVTTALRERGTRVETTTVALRNLAHDLTTMLLTRAPAPELQASLDAVAGADALVAVSPIYSGSYNGLFKTFFDVLDEGVLRGVPVLLGATAGTARHSLAIDHALRPLFAHLGALAVPTAVFAATDDFGHSSGVRDDDDVAPLADRVRRAADDLADVVASRAPRVVADPMAFTPFEEMLGGDA